LDWLAGNKAAPGHEAEFDALLVALITALESNEEVDVERFQAIGVPSYTCCDAPVVGKSAVADAWVLRRARVAAGDEAAAHRTPQETDPTPQTDEEREALADAAGYHVLELAPPSWGIPRYTRARGGSGQLGLTSFRGQFLTSTEEIIGADLVAEAWKRKTPADTLAYGHQLLGRARAVAAASGLEHLEHQRDPPSGEDRHAFTLHTVFSAGHWLVHWGSRGHFLDVWY